MNKSTTAMTNQSTTAMNTTNTTMLSRKTAAEAYWKSVKLCIARADGSAEIQHQDGRVERISADGRRVRISEEGSGSIYVTLAA